jgi:hypothetical protein
MRIKCFKSPPVTNNYSCVVQSVLFCECIECHNLPFFLRTVQMKTNEEQNSSSELHGEPSENIPNLLKDSFQYSHTPLRTSLERQRTYLPAAKTPFISYIWSSTRKVEYLLQLSKLGAKEFHLYTPKRITDSPQDSKSILCSSPLSCPSSAYQINTQCSQTRSF